MIVEDDRSTNQTADLVKHFVFTKIEKTASSTLFSIFVRFIIENRLNVLTSSRTHHVEWGNTRSRYWYRSSEQLVILLIFALSPTSSKQCSHMHRAQYAESTVSTSSNGCRLRLTQRLAESLRPLIARAICYMIRSFVVESPCQPNTLRNLNLGQLALQSYHQCLGILGWFIGPRKQAPAEVSIFHAIFNQSAFDRHLTQDVKYMASFRHPVDWFKSAVSYFRLEVNNKVRQIQCLSIMGRFDVKFHLLQSPEEVILDDRLLNKQRRWPFTRSWFVVPQLQWMGFKYSQHHNVTAIQEFTTHIRSRYKHCTSAVSILVFNSKFAIPVDLL